ncbi:MAG TPA: hypothetical protein VHD36_09085 [Pirellulales bacterium]|nr:hypothetical protein [Pirellulales bacterium]
MSRLAISLMAFLMLAAQPAELLARGGGGGRSFGGGGGGRSFGGGGGGGRSFGGGGGNFGGGRSFSGGAGNFSSAGRTYGAGGAGTRNFGGVGGIGEHSPSMSRSSSFNPGAHGTGGYAGRSFSGATGAAYGGRGGEFAAGNFNRPSAGQLGNFLGMQQSGGGNFAGGNFGGGGRVPGGFGGGAGKGPSGGGLGPGGGGKGPGGGGAGPGAGGKGPGAGGKGPGGGGKGPGGGGIAGGGKGPNQGGAGNRNPGNRNPGNRNPGNVTPQQQQHAQNIRNNIQNNHNNWYGNHNNWYGGGWWGNHGGAWNHGWNYWHGWGPGYWWGGLGVGALTGFLLGSWGTPMYYGYGAGGNVAYQDDSVYVNGQYAGTPEAYYDQAQQIAQTPVSEDAQQGDWMPLGVFAVSSRADDDHPAMMMQLAVSKQGNLAGMYYNTSDDVALPIQGAVDQKTQRAAWTVGDKKNTVLETGIFNLTKEETPVLVHFGDEKTQNWMMVRLDKPESASQDVFGPPSAQPPQQAPAPGPAAPSDS